MSTADTMIDAFCHILTAGYVERACAIAERGATMLERARSNPTMVDLADRFRIMDRFPGYRQLISLASPPTESFAGPAAARELIELANDELAELVRTHPDRFAGFVAALPLVDPEAACEEARRAFEQLGAGGVQMFTNVGGRALDAPDLLALLDALGEMGCPVWLHPARNMHVADYAGEEVSRYEIWWTVGWPLETTLAMLRLAHAGLFERRPEMVIVTHHAGGLTPMVAGRIENGGMPGGRTPEAYRWAAQSALSEAPAVAVRRFYGDTATFGSAAEIACGLEFFGVEHMLFATDMPFGPGRGEALIRDTLAAVDSLGLTAQAREAVLSGNLRRIMDRRTADRTVR